jgi:capsular exopolysaccharide synthesis family protein
MRRPCIHRAFQIRDSSGLVGYLTGHGRWQDAVRPTSAPTLFALVCGPIPPNPAELLSSERMRDLLSEATKDYEFVVLDSPPLLNVADGRILATLVDGAVLTVKGGETARDLARRAQDHIRDVGGNLIGVVLNDLDVRTGDYYYYRYDYYGRSREEA